MGIKGGANQETPLLEKRLGGNRISELLSHKLNLIGANRRRIRLPGRSGCFSWVTTWGQPPFWHFDAVM